MKRKRIIVISCFVLLLLVCVVPAVVHGYIYPNMSDDTANHLSVIERLVSGTLPEFEFRYLGYAMIGYPLWALSKLFNVEILVLFNWLNILLPFIVGLVLYFIFSRLINWVTGLLSLVIPIFVSGATIYYVYYGLIFNVVSVLILYPLLFYFIIEWLSKSKNYQLVLIIVLAVITGTFHVSGLYLPVVIGFALVVYLIYAKIKKQPICKRKVIIGLVIIAIGVACIFVIPYTRQQFIDMWKDIHGGMAHPTPQSIRMQEAYDTVLPFGYFVTTFVSFSVLAMLLVGIWQIKTIAKLISKKVVVFLMFLGCWSLIVIFSVYSHLSTIPLRQQLDFAVILSIISTIIIGILVTYNKRFLVVAVILILFGLYPQFVPTWFQDGSAIKIPDKQAIEYVKTLDIDSYDCSSNISFPIYNEYLKMPYVDGAEVLIVRNIAMTQGCEPDNPFYDGHGRTNDENYQLLKSFDDGKVKVEVFKRMKQ